MAEKAVDNGFNLSGFADRWAKQQAATSKRQEEQVKALKSTEEANKSLAEINNQSLAVKQQYAESIKPAVSEFQKLEAARQEQQTLANSGSFLDQLQAMSNAIENPQMYTSDGRNRMRGELQSSVATAALVNESSQMVLQAKQQTIQDKSTLAQAGLRQASMIEAQGLETIQAEKDRITTITQGMASNAAARGMVMDEMTRDNLTQARQAAIKDGKTNIGGFDFPIAVIDQRIAALDTQMYDLKAKAAADATRDDDLKDKADDRIVNNFSTQQLATLIDGKPIKLVGPNNEEHLIQPTDFKNSLLRSAYTNKTATASEEINRQVNESQKSDVRNLVSPAIETIGKAIQTKKIPPSSPAFRLGASLMQKFGMLAKGLEKYDGLKPEEITPQVAQTYQSLNAASTEALSKDLAAYDSAVLKQATLDGKGSKELTDAYASHYRGDPVDDPSARAVATKALVNQAEPSDILPPDVAKAAAKNMRDMVSKEMAGGQFVPSEAGMTALMKRTEIANKAIDLAVTQKVGQETTRFIGAQVVLDGSSDVTLRKNPIASLYGPDGKKVFTPESFIALVNQADTDAEEELLRDPSLSWLNQGNYLQELKNGNSVTDGQGHSMDPGTYFDRSSVMQSQHLLLNLDSVRPGLGEHYAKWWDENGRAYGDTYAKGWQQTQQAGSVQDNAFGTLGASSLYNGVNGYGTTIAAATQSFKDEKSKRQQNWVSYDMDPGNRQAAILQNDSNLSDDEKTRIYSGVIAPALEAAKKLDLGFNDANALIDEFVANPEVRIPGYKEDPALKKAVGKMVVNRGDIVRNLEAALDSPWLYGNDKQASGSFLKGLGNQSAVQNAADDPMSALHSIIAPNATARATGTVDLPVNLNPFDSSRNKWLSNETSSKPYDWYRKIQAGSIQK